MSEGIKPFHAGTQFEDWRLRNCEGCRKAWTDEKPEEFPCEIDTALNVAYFDTGEVTQEIADRMGYTTGNDGIGPYCWDCPERESV